MAPESLTCSHHHKPRVLSVSQMAQGPKTVAILSLKSAEKSAYSGPVSECGLLTGWLVLLHRLAPAVAASLVVSS